MTKIIQRHDTAANWTAANPVLAAGEMGVETDTNKFKFGNGSSTWSELAYATSGSGGSGTQLISSDGVTEYSKLILGDTLGVVDTTIKELNGLTQTGGTMNSDYEYTGGSGASLKMTEKYDLNAADSWEFQIKYKHNGGGSAPCIFGYASGSDYKCPTFLYESGALKMYMSSNGGSWNLNSASSGLAPVAGTIYFFKIGFTGSQYYIKYNTTGWDSDFITQWTLDSTTKVYCSDYFMLMNLSLNSSYYNTGTMYLQDTSLIINGEEVWRGVNVTPGPKILNANLDELGNEVNTLAGAVAEKQDKLTAEYPIKIALQKEGSLGTTVLTGDVDSSGYFTNSSGIEKYTLNTPTSIPSSIVVDVSVNARRVEDWALRTYCKIYFDKNLEYTTGDVQLDNTISVGFYHFFGGYFLSENYIGYVNTGIAIDTYAEIRKYTTTINLSRYDDTYYKIDPGTLVMVKPDGSTQTLELIGNNAGSYPITNVRIPSDAKIIGFDFVAPNNNILPNINGTVKIGATTYKPADDIGGAVYNNPHILVKTATTSSLGVVQPDGTTITVNGAGVISGQDVKTFTGYSDTGTLVLKSINGVLQWVAE